MNRTYSHPIMQAELDGGYSGQVRVTVAEGRDEESARLVFVDSEHLGWLLLTGEQAQALSEALGDAAAEIVPPTSGQLRAFRAIMGHEAPAEHTRTAADLARHASELDEATS